MDLNPTPDALPPLRTRGCVALIDDKADFVFTLASLLACGDYRVVPFTEPAPLHAFLADRVALLAQEQGQLAALGAAQRETQGTAAVEALRFFAGTGRLEVPLVLVSDYAMPAETGLSVCARHRHPGLQRILLTGVADSQVAVSAFNAGVIEHYVRKQSRDFAEDIKSALQGRLQASAERRGAQLASAFTPGFAAALAAPQVQRALRALLAMHDVREYLMLGAPQGVLATTGAGAPLWIQLETAASLQELEEVVAIAGLDGPSARRVAARQSLVAADFAQQAGLPVTEAPAQVLASAPLLLAAVHRLPADACARAGSADRD